MTHGQVQHKKSNRIVGRELSHSPYGGPNPVVVLGGYKCSHSECLWIHFDKRSAIMTCVYVCAGSANHSRALYVHRLTMHSPPTTSSTLTTHKAQLKMLSSMLRKTKLTLYFRFLSVFFFFYVLFFFICAAIFTAFRRFHLLRFGLLHRN